MLESMKPGTSVQQESLLTTLKPISDYVSVPVDESSEVPKQQKRKRQKLRKKKESGILDIVGELEATKGEAMGANVSTSVTGTRQTVGV